MSPTTSRITKGLATMCAAAAVLAPAAGAQGTQDLRSPDGSDGGVQVGPAQDLRSPDATGGPATAQAASYTPAPSEGSSGSDWDTVGIVAGSALLLGAVGFGLFAVSRRRRHHKPRVPAISS